MSGVAPGSAADGPPVLRVVRGSATAEELAAVVAVLSARPAEPATAPPPPRPAPSAWRRAYGLRRPVVPGPGAWRASGLPGG